MCGRLAASISSARQQCENQDARFAACSAASGRNKQREGSSAGRTAAVLANGSMPRPTISARELQQCGNQDARLDFRSDASSSGELSEYASVPAGGSRPCGATVLKPRCCVVAAAGPDGALRTSTRVAASAHSTTTIEARRPRVAELEAAAPPHFSDGARLPPRPLLPSSCAPFPAGARAACRSSRALASLCPC